MATRYHGVRMIVARHEAWAEWIFLPYVRGLLRRHFHALRLVGELPELDPDLPLLIAPNHGTWWDGFFVYILNRLVLKRQLFLMMLDEQLSRYRFFSRVGAFGIRPGLPRSVLETLRYSAGVLQDPRHALCLFPQGELRYHALRPLGYQRGVERVLKLSGRTIQLLPLGIRCELIEDQRPEAFFLADHVHVVDSESFLGAAWLEAETEGLIDRMETAIRTRAPGRVLLRGKTPVDDRWARQ